VFLFPATPATGAGDMNYTVVVLGGVLILLPGLLLFPQVWWEELVHRTRGDGRYTEEATSRVDGDREKENATVEVVRTKQ
jgi:hypothetical protein